MIERGVITHSIYEKQQINSWFLPQEQINHIIAVCYASLNSEIN